MEAMSNALLSSMTNLPADASSLKAESHEGTGPVLRDSLVPMQVYVGTLVVLGLCCLAVLVRTVQRSTSRSVEETMPPGFSTFQRNYLTVYLLCTFSDWLKGPYVYALYEDYGFSTWQIAQLFIMGYISSLIFGTMAGAFSDKWGRKFMCQFFCVIYGLSAFTKVVNNFWVLLFGRALSGVATSLLFTTFEAWMVSEHHGRGFPQYLLTDTFSKATLMNGCGAIAAGIAAQIAAQWSYAMPFLVAVPCLAAALFFISPWSENYGCATIAPLSTVSKGFNALRQDRRLLWLGSCEAAFEGCMYVWVFFWTPALSTPESRQLLPYGLIFASYMGAFMLGGYLPQRMNADSLAYWLHSVALAVTAISAVFFQNKIVVFFTFVVFEGTVGSYFPTHGTIRSKAIDESTRAAVMNLFRVPLNLYVVLLLQIQWTAPQALGILALTHFGSLWSFHMFKKTNAAVLLGTKDDDGEKSTGSVSPSQVVVGCPGGGPFPSHPTTVVNGGTGSVGSDLLVSSSAKSDKGVVDRKTPIS